MDFQDESGSGVCVELLECAGRSLKSDFFRCPWAWGCWGWEMGQQAEGRPVGGNPDLQRLGEGSCGVGREG